MAMVGAYVFSENPPTYIRCTSTALGATFLAKNSFHFFFSLFRNLNGLGCTPVWMLLLHSCTGRVLHLPCGLNQTPLNCRFTAVTNLDQLSSQALTNKRLSSFMKFFGFSSDTRNPGLSSPHLTRVLSFRAHTQHSQAQSAE